MKRLFVLFFVLFVGSIGFSQNEELDSLTIQLAYQNPDTSKVNTSISIIKLLFQSKDFSKASKFIQQSEKLANDLGYKEGLAKIIYYKAKIYQEEGRTVKAINTLKNARLLFSEVKDTLSVAKVNSSLGVLEIESGNYKEGLSYALSSINELEKRNRFEDLSSIYKSLANAYKTSGNLDKAITYNLKRLNADNQSNNTKRLVETNKDLGDIYSTKKNYTQAISYYESALGYANSSDTNLRASILPYLGDAYLKKDDYKTSARYLVEAIKLNREVDNKKEMAIALNALGELNLVQNRLQTAEEQLLEAANIGKIANDDVALMENYRLMKTLDSIKGNFESAFVWQSEYHKLKEKLDSQQTKVTSLITEEVDQEANQDTILIPDT
ncbi:MAG TPA: tetratricopeptide repeat protein, partial [Flavobacteriaceae bacterium]|nr:tetratricopeptide repeat protein [Flavobacteriaceae bacterium]